MRLVSRSIGLLEQRPGRTFAAIGAVLVAAYVIALAAFPRSHGRLLDGDAIQYYAYLRSIVFDGDVDFRNEYAVLYRPASGAEPDNVWLTARTPTGLAPNMMSIGPALLWSPVFLLVYLGVALLGFAGADVACDGFAAPFQLSAGVAGIAYATLGAYLGCRLAARLYPSAPAFWGAVVGWLATPAVYYSLVSPAYSHAVSLFAVALFANAWFDTRNDDRARRAVLLGALGGLALLVRWQDVIVFALPAFELARRVARRQLAPARAFGLLSIMAAVAAVALLPQALAWLSLYGTPLVMPQGAGFMRWTAPEVWQVLFSTRHGLFLWTPAALLAVAGLAGVTRRDVDLGWGALLVFLLSLYVNASVSDWWAGEAFGARRFVSDTVFFAVGLAALFSGLQRLGGVALARAVALSLVAYNLLFLLQYQLFMRGFRDLAPYPSTVRQILLDRLVIPWRLLEAWLRS